MRVGVAQPLDDVTAAFTRWSCFLSQSILDLSPFIQFKGQLKNWMVFGRGRGRQCVGGRGGGGGAGGDERGLLIRQLHLMWIMSPGVHGQELVTGFHEFFFIFKEFSIF